jgi:predicted Zn-dependent protease
MEDRFDEATLELQRLVADEPEHVAARVVAGLICEVTERPAEAVAAYRAALYLAPELYQVRILLADLLRRSGEAQRAVREYRKVVVELLEGSVRELEGLEELPLPDRRQALARSRTMLERLEGRSNGR